MISLTEPTPSRRRFATGVQELDPLEVGFEAKVQLLIAEMAERDRATERLVSAVECALVAAAVVESLPEGARLDELMEMISETVRRFVAEL